MALLLIELVESFAIIILDVLVFINSLLSTMNYAFFIASPSHS